MSRCSILTKKMSAGLAGGGGIDLFGKSEVTPITSCKVYEEISGISVTPGVVDDELCQRVRESLMDDGWHEQSEIIIGDSRHPAPRLTSSFADNRLSLEGMSASRLWTPELLTLRNLVTERFGLAFNYALANLYRNSNDYTGWHCDKAWLHCPGSTIAIVSFGATRHLELRRLGENSIKRIPLPEGSVVLMDLGLQATHEHRIPIESGDVGARLSITLRHIEMRPEYLGR